MVGGGSCVVGGGSSVRGGGFWVVDGGAWGVDGDRCNDGSASEVGVLVERNVAAGVSVVGSPASGVFGSGLALRLAVCVVGLGCGSCRTAADFCSTAGTWAGGAGAGCSAATWVAGARAELVDATSLTVWMPMATIPLTASPAAPTRTRGLSTRLRAVDGGGTTKGMSATSGRAGGPLGSA